jgi:hypothetical protein
MGDSISRQGNSIKAPVDVRVILSEPRFPQNYIVRSERARQAINFARQSADQQL